MKLRFVVGSKQESKNGDIEALADAMRALKNEDYILLEKIRCFLNRVLGL